MIGQTNPQLLRVVEETVANLKQLETCIETLRVDIAGVAQSIGHPEAAQRALSSGRALQGQLPFGAGGGQLPFTGAANIPNWGQTSSGIQSPYSSQNPYASQSPYGVQSPYAFQNPFALRDPYALQSAALTSPWATSVLSAAPWIGSHVQSAVSPTFSPSFQAPQFAPQTALSSF